MSIYRDAENRALKQMVLSGEVLDLGGHATSSYRTLFKGVFSITTANMPGSGETIECDFEQPLPIADRSYDAILLMNVLEHIFEYRLLLKECARILKSGGIIIIATPFLLPYHPSPGDFHRYTSDALERALSLSGFSEVSVLPLGSGVCAARWGLIERLLPGAIQKLAGFVMPFISFSDAVIARLARTLGKKYQPSDYALAYITKGRIMENV